MRKTFLSPVFFSFLLLLSPEGGGARGGGRTKPRGRKTNSGIRTHCILLGRQDEPAHTAKADTKPRWIEHTSVEPDFAAFLATLRAAHYCGPALSSYHLLCGGGQIKLAGARPPPRTNQGPYRYGGQQFIPKSPRPQQTSNKQKATNMENKKELPSFGEIHFVWKTSLICNKLKIGRRPPRAPHPF